MNIAAIKYCDIANGPGVRTSVFVSGCTHACPGCFNKEAQNFSFGEPYTDQICEQVLKSLEPPYIKGLTILGGEPMEPSNQPFVCDLLRAVREEFETINIWLYTGDVLEGLLDPHYHRNSQYTAEILKHIDVLVDGLFLQNQADTSLRFKGSKNQRIIDMSKTLRDHKIILWSDN